MPRINRQRAAEKRAEILATIPSNASDEFECSPLQAAAIKGLSLSTVMKSNLPWRRYSERILRIPLGTVRAWGKATIA